MHVHVFTFTAKMAGMSELHRTTLRQNHLFLIDHLDFDNQVFRGYLLHDNILSDHLIQKVERVKNIINVTLTAIIFEGCVIIERVQELIVVWPNHWRMRTTLLLLDTSYYIINTYHVVLSLILRHLSLEKIHLRHGFRVEIASIVCQTFCSDLA